MCEAQSGEKLIFTSFDSKTRRKRAIFCYKTPMPPALGLKTGVFKTPWGYYEWKNRSHLFMIFEDKQYHENTDRLDQKQCTICFWFETPILTQRLVSIPDMSLAKVLLLYEAQPD